MILPIEKEQLSVERVQTCEVGVDLAVLGKRWTIHIIRHIGTGHIDRFNKILKSLPGLTPRVLIIRLKELERRGLIRPIVLSVGPRVVRWELTEKGTDALPIAEGYNAFAKKWYTESNLANHRSNGGRSTETSFGK